MKKASISDRVGILIYIASILVLLLAGYEVYTRFIEQKTVNDELSTLRSRYSTLVETRDSLNKEIADYQVLFDKLQEEQLQKREELLIQKEQEKQEYLASLPTLYSAAPMGEEVKELFIKLDNPDLDMESSRAVVYQLQRHFAKTEDMASLVSYTSGGVWAFHDVAFSFNPSPRCWTQFSDGGDLALVYFADWDAESETFSNKNRVLVNYEGFVESLLDSMEAVP